MIIFVGLTLPVVAQPRLDLVSYYDFDEAGLESFDDIYSLGIGEFYIAGKSGDRGLVARIEADGGVNWIEFFQSSSFFSVIETDRGEALAGGTIGGQFGAALLDSGELIWQNDYRNGVCNAVIELKQGDFVLGGTSASSGYLVMINSEGEPIWSQTYGGQEDRWSIRALREGEDAIIAAGDISSSPRKGWILSTDFDGNTNWLRIYENQGGSGFASMCSMQGGSYALISDRNNPDQFENEFNFALTIVNDEGEIAVDRRYRSGDLIIDKGYGIARLSNQDVVMVGYTSFFSGNRRNTHIASRISSGGELIWANRFPEIEPNPSAGQIRNVLKSIVVLPGDQIIVCGTIINFDNQDQTDAVIIRLEPDPMQPFIFHYLPEDTVLSILDETELDFMVYAVNRRGVEMTYEWHVRDSLLSTDTSVTYRFEGLGLFDVECIVSDDDWATGITWHVTVTDLFIAAHSPDTLDLALGRGTTVDFSIDSVAAVNRDGLTYAWRVSREGEALPDSGEDAQATIEFPRSGHYTIEGLAHIPDGPSDVVNWDVTVRGAIWSFLPEETGLTGLVGSEVEFQIIPTLSDSTNWFTWLYDGGMITEGRDSVFVMNFFELGEHAVTGILADTVESDTVTWTINVLSNSVPPSLSLRPSALSLSASPNPFNSTLTIRFSVGAQGLAPLRLAVYDLSGREVAHLFDSSSPSPSVYGEGEGGVVTWNASSLPAGIYILRLQQGDQIDTRKVVLLR